MHDVTSYVTTCLSANSAMVCVCWQCDRYPVCKASAARSHLSSTSGAFDEVQLVILLYEELYHPTCHNVQLPGHIIHAVQVAVRTQIHLHNASRLCKSSQCSHDLGNGCVGLLGGQSHPLHQTCGAEVYAHVAAVKSLHTQRQALTQYGPQSGPAQCLEDQPNREHNRSGWLALV